MCERDELCERGVRGEEEATEEEEKRRRRQRDAEPKTKNPHNDVGKKPYFIPTTIHSNDFKRLVYFFKSITQSYQQPLCIAQRPAATSSGGTPGRKAKGLDHPE